MIVTALAGFLAGAAAAAADPAGTAGRAAGTGVARVAGGAILLGLVALGLREVLPDAAASGLAAKGSGAVLVVLGLWAIHVSLQMHLHGHDAAHEHHHDHDHAHGHDHPHDHDHDHDRHDRQDHPHDHAGAHGHAHLHAPGAGPSSLLRALAVAPAIVLAPRAEAMTWVVGVAAALAWGTAVLGRLVAEAESAAGATRVRTVAAALGAASVAIGCLRVLRG